MNKAPMRTLILSVILALSMFSCKKENTDTPQTTPVPVDTSKLTEVPYSGVFISIDSATNTSDTMFNCDLYFILTIEPILKVQVFDRDTKISYSTETGIVFTYTDNTSTTRSNYEGDCKGISFKYIRTNDSVYYRVQEKCTAGLDYFFYGKKR